MNARLNVRIVPSHRTYHRYGSAEFFRLVMPAKSPPSVAPLNEYDLYRANTKRQPRKKVADKK